MEEFLFQHNEAEFLHQAIYFIWNDIIISRQNFDDPCTKMKVELWPKTAEANEMNSIIG